MAWRTSYSAGSVLTAADMNAIAALGNAWSPWSPTVSGLTTGNGSQTARYVQPGGTGKTVDFFWMFTFGSTSAVTGALKITLPATAKFANQGFGDAAAFDTSAGFYYPMFGTSIDTSTVNIWTGPSTAGSRYINIGSTVPFTWAAGDVVAISGRYEAA